jgi:hypothetical protein
MVTPPAVMMTVTGKQLHLSRLRWWVVEVVLAGVSWMRFSLVLRCPPPVMLHLSA